MQIGVDKRTHFIVYYQCCISYMRAVVAQSVERRLGKAEVGGSIPLDSLENPLIRQGIFFGNGEAALSVPTEKRLGGMRSAQREKRPPCPGK